MLVGVISGPSYQDIVRQINKSLVYAEALEFRFDLFDEISCFLLKILRNKLKLPLIFTYRSKLHLQEVDRIDLLKDLLDLKPEYVDLEVHLSKEVFFYFSSRTKVICSYHNFEKTPEDLEGLLITMQEKNAALYKICTTANSSLDALSMLIFVSNHINIIGMCMGILGQITRILGPIVGSRFIYGSIEEPVAPGQISLEELRNIYYYHQLSKDTKIFALLGDPIDKSIGHIFHNRIFSLKQDTQIDGGFIKGADSLTSIGRENLDFFRNIYVKISIKKEELSSFFKMVEVLPFYGFSVTMPLKEVVMEYMDDIDPVAKKIGAVNTIVRGQGWHGFNTDGLGAFLAIEKHIQTNGKKALVIGAGGAARAIINALVENKTDVLILNRTKEKAISLANEFGVQWKSMEELPDILAEGLDLIVNTVPDASFFSSQLSICNNRPYVLDMVYNPIWTDLLLVAKRTGCRCIFGYEMFIHQAVIQQRLFNKKIAFANSINSVQCNFK